MQINLSPADIQAFLSIAETGSFSDTGIALGLSQPAVSSRISHLEQMLGVPLFHRSTRRVTITHAGERLRIRLEHAMAELRGLVGELQDEANLRRGRVTLGASPSVASGFLAGVISRFHAEHPNVEIVLNDDFYGHVLDRLSRGEVDLAVIPFEPDEETFEFELLFTDRFLLAVPLHHRLAGRKTVVLKDLMAERLVTMPTFSAAWSTIKRAYDQAGLPFNPSMQTRNSLTTIALVREGFGVAFITELLARTVPVQGLVLLQVGSANLERRVGIVTLKGRALLPAVSALCGIMRDKAVETASAPRGLRERRQHPARRRP